MKNFALWLLAQLARHRAKIRFCLRMTVVGLITYGVGQLLTIPLQGLWMVLTALVLTQMSVGGSIRVTLEYVVGTVGGAVYGGLLGVLFPHATPWVQAGVLILAIAPLALAASLHQYFRAAPFSAVLVLLLSNQLGEGPIGSAFYRLLEVALGGLATILVSMLVFPERASTLSLNAATRVLNVLANMLPELIGGLIEPMDPAANPRIQDEIGRAVSAYQTIAKEAENEHLVNVAAAPDQGPLSRTLLRLRHDYVLMGRAAAVPLPPQVAIALKSHLEPLCRCAVAYLRGSARALTARTEPADIGPFEAALEAYGAEIDLLRNTGVTLAMSTAEVESMFAFGFALEQLHQNFLDLRRCVRQFSQSEKNA
jgi:uncharacterized membrane protein YccC